MKNEFDISQLEWTLTGHTPFLWKFELTYSPSQPRATDTPPLPARIPGSVQAALRDAGLIPDWTIGDNARSCEWVEHRHWIYTTEIQCISVTAARRFRLECLGLDYSGWVYVNDAEVGGFRGSHVPHVFDVSDALLPGSNTLSIIFDIPPRWLGMCGYSSMNTEWKPRFNYTWDWVPRIVQAGFTDAVKLIVTDGNEIESLSCAGDADPVSGTGILHAQAAVRGNEARAATVTLRSDDKVIHAEQVTAERLAYGIRWDALPVDLWWPNLQGEQPVYSVTVDALDADGVILDSATRKVGFRSIEWRPCEGAPVEADPWVCVVNGRPTFLQGVNYAPIRANYADVTDDDHRKRLGVYRDLGANMVRINACGFLETEGFYDICDELGILVWQDFPLTSSGIENWPPEDERAIDEMEAIARSFVIRRRNHPSLALWCGGNELMGNMEGEKHGMGKPCGLDHPMLRRLADVVSELDPQRRYVAASPSGPRAGANPAEFGAGVNWDVHGPYVGGTGAETWADYWERDDALFRSEVSVAGAAPAAIIRRHKGDLCEFPPTRDNPYWARPTHWWIDWETIVAELGREPTDLDEYVRLSQKRQADLLAHAMKACKDRFPRMGGVLLWTGHDCYPVPINTSIVDYDGNPKPAAHALARVWREDAQR